MAGIAADAVGEGVLQMSRIGVDPFNSLTVRIPNEAYTRRPAPRWLWFARDLGALFLQPAANRTDVIAPGRHTLDPEFHG